MSNNESEKEEFIPSRKNSRGSPRAASAKHPSGSRRVMKKLFKYNQFIGEKIGYKETSKEKDEVADLEKKFHALTKYYTAFQEKVEHFLRPDSATRTKIKLSDSFGIKSSKEVKYPQTEDAISEALSLGTSDIVPKFAEACISAGNSFRSISNLKDELETTLRNDVLYQIVTLRKSKINDIHRQLKKYEDHRVSYASIKDKKDMDSEIPIARTKYLESKSICHRSLVDFIENSEKLHVDLIKSFNQAVEKFYEGALACSRKSTEELERISLELENKLLVTVSPYIESDQNSLQKDYYAGETVEESPSGYMRDATQGSQELRIKARVKYDFEAREKDELDVKEGCEIEILEQLDENWYSASYRGTIGIIPTSYVIIL